MTKTKLGLFVIPFIVAIMIGSLGISTDLSYSQTSPPVDRTTFIPDPDEPGKFVHAGSGKQTFDATTFKHLNRGDDKTKFSHAGTTGAVDKTTFIQVPGTDKFAHAHSGTGTLSDATTFKHLAQGDDKSKFSHAGTTGAVDKTTFIPVPQDDGTVKFVHAGSGKQTFDATTFKHVPQGDDKSNMSHAGTTEPPQPSCQEQCDLELQQCLEDPDNRDCEQEHQACSLQCSSN